jgi:zinc/manganese transport system permease protein
VLMPFGLGLGILFLAINPGRSANRFGLLTGQVVSVDTPQVFALSAVALVVLVGLVLIWRPLLFASVDEDVATARGVPVRILSLLFMVLLALTVSIAVQTVGALLVLALLVTPAAAALKVASGPLVVSLLSMAFAVVSILGGILLALGAAIPISPYVTTISFAIYLVCRLLGARRQRRVPLSP